MLRAECSINAQCSMGDAQRSTLNGPRFTLNCTGVEAMIRTRIFAVSVALSMAALMLAASTRTAAQASASAQSSADRSAALTGLVSSQAEGPMEGVVVSATRTGSTMTVSVMSDAQGRYAFPAHRLEPGAYSIHIRATGYDLESPSAVDVLSGRTSQLDLKLRKTQDLAAQLTNGEWFMSWPGTTEMKNGLLNCTQCHTLERVARSTHTAEQWVPVLQRMGRYAQGSTPERPQLRPHEHGGGNNNPIMQQSMSGREGEDPVMKDRVGAAAKYLATINLSDGTHDVDVSAKDVSRVRPERPRASSSPNTVCRAKRRCRMTPRPIRRAMSGTPTSARTCSACWSRRPAR
jgi:hypothetical protein